MSSAFPPVIRHVASATLPPRGIRCNRPASRYRRPVEHASAPCGRCARRRLAKHLKPPSLSSRNCDAMNSLLHIFVDEDCGILPVLLEEVDEFRARAGDHVEEVLAGECRELGPP